MTKLENYNNTIFESIKHTDENCKCQRKNQKKCQNQKLINLYLPVAFLLLRKRRKIRLLYLLFVEAESKHSYFNRVGTEVPARFFSCTYRHKAVPGLACHCVELHTLSPINALIE